MFKNTKKWTWFACCLVTICLLSIVGCQKCDNQECTTGHRAIFDDSLAELEITELQAKMEDGSLTAVQLTQYYLDRIAAVDDAGPTLNAVLEINPEALNIAAQLDDERKADGPRGSMHGIPVMLKANIDTGDQMATTAGSLALAGFKAADDAFLVAQLRKAGAIILGKTNLSEWANFRSTNSSSGWSSLGRQTKNPYALDRNPCGSSSGSGVAVSANLTSVAIGTETDGSIMCPSGLNGVVGIKPTLGLVSRSGIIPIAHSQDTAGPMARTVADAAILLTAMASKDESDPAASSTPSEMPDFLSGLQDSDLSGVRIGVLRDYHGSGNSSEVEALFDSAIASLVDIGVEVIDDIDMGDTDGMDAAEFTVLLYEFKADLALYLKNHGAPNGMHNLEDLMLYNQENASAAMPYFEQELFEMAVAKGDLTEKEYLDALDLAKSLSQNAINSAIENNNLIAIIAPTNGPAWPTDLINGDNFSVASSSLAAVSGYPSITVPMGNVHGLPVGISIFGKAYTEPELIRVALGFEREVKARNSPEFLPTLDFK